MEPIAILKIEKSLLRRRFGQLRLRLAQVATLGHAELEEEHRKVFSADKYGGVSQSEMRKSLVLRAVLDMQAELGLL